MKKVYKLTLIPLLSFLILLSIFLVGCSNKENNAHPADSIPDSNVYEDIGSYLMANGEEIINSNNTTYTMHILGNKDSKKQFLIQYDKTYEKINIGGVQYDNEQNPLEFIIVLPKLSNYSNFTHSIQVQYSYGKNYFASDIFLPATQFIDMTKTIALPHFDNVNTNFSETEQNQLHAEFSKIVAQFLYEFSNFYANIIKKDSNFIGAIFKYFYLPVINIA